MRVFLSHSPSVSTPTVDILQNQCYILTEVMWFLLEQVPDYTTVIKQPMDLSTVISKIDLHKYETVAAYLLDVDLIWQNALEYNPDRDPSGRLGIVMVIYFI